MPSFQSRDNSFFRSGIPTLLSVAPASGSTVTVRDGISSVFINNPSTLASLFISLPPNPRADDTVSIKFRSAVTTLSVASAAGVVGPTTAAALARLDFKYIDAVSVWVVW